MILIYAEKQKVAQAIQKSLCFKTESKKIGIYTLYISKQFIILGLSGHVIERKYEYIKWTDPLKRLLSAKIHSVLIDKDLKKVVQEIKKYKIENILCSTDNDAEGELIGKDFYEYLVQQGLQKPVNRMVYNSLTKEEIQKAFENLQSLRYSLAEASHLKHCIDLQWGAILTRYLTVVNKSRSVLSAGRVQTPVLTLLVDRHNAIINHKPEKYYKVCAYYEGLEFSYISSHKLDLPANCSCIIYIKEEKTLKFLKPYPLNTTDLLIIANKIQIPSQITMAIAQKLYLEGNITYIRTDSQVYPDQYDHTSVLSTFSRDDLINKTYRKGKIDTAHIPITPTTKIPENLNELENKVYTLIKQRYFDIFSQDAIFKRQVLAIDINSITLTANYDVTINPGWCNYKKYTTDFKQTNTELQILQEELQTKPKKMYTEAQLIKKMETLGIGTKSTRHTYVALLKSRKYIDNRLIPSKLAKTIIQHLKDTAPEITGNELTKSIEEQMEQVISNNIAYNIVFTKFTQKMETILNKLNVS